MGVGHANAGGGHVIHAVGFPRFTFKPETALAGEDEFGLGFCLPNTEFMRERIQELPAGAQLRGHNLLSRLFAKPCLIASPGLAGRKRNCLFEQLPPRVLPRFRQMHGKLEIVGGGRAEVHHFRPNPKPLAVKEGEELTASFGQEDTAPHSGQDLAETVGHQGLEVKTLIRGRENRPDAAAKRRRDMDDHRGHRAPVITRGAIIGAEQGLPPKRPILG